MAGIQLGRPAAAWHFVSLLYQEVIGSVGLAFEIVVQGCVFPLKPAQLWQVLSWQVVVSHRDAQ
jgi:hypothetical protein